MRWFGIIAVLGAAPALYLAGRARGGAIGGFFAMAVVLLSPNTVVMAGEIRAYPLFLTFAAWASWCYLRCLEPTNGNRLSRLAALSVMLALSAYTHFFGVVFASAILASLFAERILAGKGAGRVLVAGLCCAAALLGLIPFLMSAVSVSTDTSVVPSTSFKQVAIDLARLGYRLFLHGSHSVYLFAFISTALGLLGLIILLLLRDVKKDHSTFRSKQTVFLLLPLALAGVTLPILDFLIGSFAVLAPHYNIWMLPLVAILLAGPFVSDEVSSWYTRFAKGFAVIALTGHLVASAVLLQNASLYSHGPGEWVADLWSDTNRPIVIHDGSGVWAHAYFPLHYLSGGTAVQLLAQSDGTLSRILPDGLEPVSEFTRYVSQLDRFLRVRVEDMDSNALARIARGEGTCKPQPPLGAKEFNSDYYCAYAAAAVSTEPKIRQ